MSNRSQRKRERQQKRYEQRKLEAQRNPGLELPPPRIGITAEAIEDLARRSLANVFAEIEQEENK